MSEKELSDWASRSNISCLTFSVSDRYGDSGLTAFVSFENSKSHSKVIDFFMSCRVMGKGIEYAIVNQIINKNKNNIIYMDFVPSERNSPIQEFCGKVSSNGILNKEIKCPKYIKVINV